MNESDRPVDELEARGHDAAQVSGGEGQPTLATDASALGRNPPKSKTPWWLLLAALGGLLVPACGVLAALGIYGVRKYVITAKEQEARSSLPAFATAIAGCANALGRLPPSSSPVPHSLSSVSGAKYQSSMQDWESDETLGCAKFSFDGPQYYQYQWVLDSPSMGHVRAVSDLDGDGEPDEREFALSVECFAVGQCAAGGAVELSK